MHRHTLTPLHSVTPLGHEGPDARVSRLAAEFLEHLAGRDQWPAIFAGWARGLRLSEADARAVRVAVLRARVFHATQRARRA